MQINERIKEIRIQRNQTQEQIANILNIPYQQYSKYERGIHIMNIEKLIILAKHYNVSLDYITGIIDEIKPIY